jgi:hypothetical protein
MRKFIDQVEEGLNHATMEVYHFTSAEYLIKILQSDCIEVGASPHKLNGQTLEGVSVTRNKFFDISNTYAVSGKKPWRIGLDYRKLRQRFKVEPVRDEYLRTKPKSVVRKTGLGLFGRSYDERVSSDESEEFVLGSIQPLGKYITSISVEETAVDASVHPYALDDDPEYYEGEHEIEGVDQHLFFSILSQTNPELFGKLSAKLNLKPYVARIGMDYDVPLQLIYRDPNQVVSI